MTVERIKAKTRVQVYPPTPVEVWPPVSLRSEIYYPESDGEPMAETDVHADSLIYLREALKDYYRDNPDVYVAGDLLIYYQEGDPQQRVAPDVFVVFGVVKKRRRIYQVWKEGKAPDVVFELTSRGTRWKDLGAKKGIYEALGVREYFIFDPLEEYLKPQLRSYRLEDGEYVRLDDPGSVMRSEVLGLELRVRAGELRLYDPATGEDLLSPLEAQAARRQAEERATQAEAELARLRAELDRLLTL